MNFIPYFENTFLEALFWAFCVAACIQLMYSFLVFGRLAFHREKSTELFEEPISIIIAARNEADNLFDHLPYILEQKYKKFEVIVISHQSTDETIYILNAFKQQYPNLHIVEIEKSKHLRPGKKLALTIGVKAAKYEHLIFTDADCKPQNFNWLQSIANGFAHGKEIVIGVGPYTKEPTFLNQLIRFDTTWIAINYLSMALLKLPYMAVGRNMGYTKTVFNRVHGFKDHYTLSSGDDDLFIQQAAKKNNYSIVYTKDSFMYSTPHQQYKRWFFQKSRHFTATPFYGVIKKSMLGIYPLSMLLMLICFVSLLATNDLRWVTSAILLFVIVIKWWILGRCFIKLQEKKLVYPFLIFDLIYVFLIPIMYYSSDVKKKNKW